MRHIAENKTLKNTLFRSGIAFYLVLAGCANEPVKPVGQQKISVRAEQYDQSISQISRVIEKNPQNARAYYERGLVYYEMGQYDNAWQDVRTAQSLGYNVPAEFLKLLSEAQQVEK